MSDEERHAKELREREEERREGEPVREGEQGSEWSGEPTDEAERRRGAGRGLDEPAKPGSPDTVR
jgi:hypothetical protein